MTGDENVLRRVRKADRRKFISSNPMYHWILVKEKSCPVAK